MPNPWSLCKRPFCLPLTQRWDAARSQTDAKGHRAMASPSAQTRKQHAAYHHLSQNLRGLQEDLR